MLRSAAQVRSQVNAAAKHAGMTRHHDGRMWTFWSLAPANRTVWLTDGREFICWDLRNDERAYHISPARPEHRLARSPHYADDASVR